MNPYFQTEASKHYCPYCSDSAPWLECKSLSTVGSLWESYWAFMSQGSNLSKAMETGNVVNPPLVTGSQDERILDLFFIPEMHVMTGNVEKLVRELERCQGFTSEEHGSNFMYLWIKKNNICKIFHRESPNFTGNMARKLLHFSLVLSTIVICK